MAHLLIAPPTYRSDAAGLVCAYRFGADGSGTAIGGDEARAWLAGTRTTDSPEFAWLHFDLSNVAAEKWMRGHLGLPDVFFEALADGTSSARIELAEDTLVAVLNDVLYEFAFEATHVSTLGCARRARC
jgi:zinc transporter